MKPARTWPDGRREVVKRFFRDAIPKIELKVAPITDPESMRRPFVAGVGDEMRRMPPVCSDDIVIKDAHQAGRVPVR